MDEAGIFHQIPRLDDSRLGEIFAREVLAMFVRKELLSPEWAERILSWRHTGFSVHTEYAVADKFMEHLKLTFVAEKPPPAHVFEQVVLLAAEKSGEYE